jgi:hypothetical protein
MISWRRDTRLAKAGSRLLAAQLKTADAVLGTVEAEGMWVRFYGLPMSAWPEYRGVLAAKLGNRDFDSVAECVPALAQFGEDMQNSPAWDEDTAAIRLPARAVGRLGELRSGAANAYNALAGLAGHDPVGDRIHS